MNRKVILLLTAGFLSLCCFTGCATIIHGSKQKVHFSSNPEGAKVIVDEKELGTTPVSVKLKRSEIHQIKMEKANYKPYTTILRKKVSTWFWGNAFCFAGFWICFPVDYFSGSMNKLEKDSVCVDLVGTGGAAEDITGSSEEALPAADGTVRNIAVLDMKSMGVGDHVAQLLTEKLRSEFFSTGTYNVMNREDMSKVMTERDFQRSEECDTPECFAEIGRMLGVEKIVTGSIGKLGSTYSLTLKQIDIESSKNEKIINLSEKCEEDHLFKMITDASRQLMRAAGR
jgi:hypothetical protein